MKMFIINGVSGSGKNQFVEYVAEHLHGKKLVHHLSYVDPIRYGIIPSWCGIHGEDEQLREDDGRLATYYMSKALELLKTEDGTSVIDKKLEDYIETYSCYDVLFMDAREKETVERYKEKYDATTVYVFKNTDMDDVPNNTGDLDAYLYRDGYDVYIYNNGTLEELRHQAEVFCNNFIEE